MMAAPQTLIELWSADRTLECCYWLDQGGATPLMRA
jgi:hypothetical protein